MNSLVKRIVTPALLASLLAGGAGCSSNPRIVNVGAATGLVGAATGAAIGHQKGRGLEGAAIGGAIGILSGMAIGAANPARAAATAGTAVAVPQPAIAAPAMETTSAYQLPSAP